MEVKILRTLLFLLLLLTRVNGQIRLKRVAFLSSGARGEWILCADTDHNRSNELIFINFSFTSPTRWEIWEHRPMNRYELVFADTGRYPYPPGITTGNFEPMDVSDIDRDSLIDLVGPNYERANDSTFNVVTTQESPNYSTYPRNLSWWYRFAYNEVVSQPFYFPPDLDSDSIREILITAPSPLGITIFENVANNQNVIVWNRIQGIAAWSFTFGDFDLDARKEFVTAWLGSLGRVFIFENTADNQYELIRVDTVRLPNGGDVFSGNDLDGDGRPEFFVGFARIVGGNVWDYFLYMWEATGNNIYARILIDQIRGSDYSEKRSYCGDIDGDGIEEIVWSIGDRVMVYKATGDNQFQRVWQWWNDHGGAPYYEAMVNVFDMNNNGYNEIVMGGYGKTSIFEVEAVQLLRPNGGETFQYNTQELIRWLKFYPPRCDSLSLFYSINNGRTYLQIASCISASDTSYLWTVPNVSSDSCKVKIIAYGPGWQYDESDGLFRITTTSIEEEARGMREEARIRIYPNPAKTQSVIRYTIPVEGKVSLNLYDILGRLIKTLVNENKKPGNYKLIFNTKTLSAGVYFLSLETQEKRVIKRLIVVK